MCRDPAEWQTTETHVMIPLCLIRWQKKEACVRVHKYVWLASLPHPHLTDASKGSEDFKVNFLMSSWHDHQAWKKISICQSSQKEKY